MSAVFQYLISHPTTSTLLGYWIFSNVISALQSPSNDSGMTYKFFFALMHGLAGSVPRVFPNFRLPSDPTQGSQTYFAKPNGNGDVKQP